MKFLTAPAWEQFKRYDRTPVAFNGDEFEALVRILLKDFPGTWEGTPRTRDGGKDVVDRSIPSDVAWAECKMYRVPISLQVVSNTLVMAIIESNVRRILFFSYSTIKSNAKHYLARYALQTQKTVQVYDADLLEALILRSPEAMARYFPQVDLPLVPATKDDRPVVKGFFSMDVHVRQHQLAHMDDEAKPREHHISINTPCLYELVLASRHVGACQDIEVQVNTAEIEKHFTILNAEQVESYRRLTLSGGQTLSLPIYLAPTVSGAVNIPAIYMQTGTAPALHLPPVPLQVSAFERPLLVGNVARETLAELESMVSSGNVNRAWAVSGRSGVGKSRLIDEAMTRLLKNGYEIHYFDGIYVQGELDVVQGTDRHKALSAKLIRGLICSLWRMPDPTPLADGKPAGTPGETISPGEFGLVSEMVYCWDAERLLQDRAAVIDVIVKGYASRRNALVIDNVQAYPETLIGLLDSVLQGVVALPGQSFLLLAFNEDDLVFNAAASIWLHTLRASHGDVIHYVNLPEFARPQAVEFINNLFEHNERRESYSDTHPETLNLILDKILPRPLDLWQFAKGLEDRAAIRVGQNAFTIVDFTAFNEALQELHPEREVLLNWRMRRLCAVADLDVALAAISYLGPLSRHEMGRLSIADSVSQTLIQASVLRENREHKLEFYHPSLTRHFTRHSQGDTLLAPAAKRALYERGRQVHAHVGYEARWFGLAFDVGAELAPIVTAAAAEFVGQDAAGFSPLHLAADRLLAYVQGQLDIPQWWPVLPALAGAAHIAAQGAISVLPARTGHLYEMARRLAPASPPDNASLPHWTHVIREMAGYMDSNDSAKADSILCVALESLEKADLAAAVQEVALARAHFLNRRCVTLKNLGRGSDAIAVAQASRELAESHGFVDLVCLNWVDMGYVDFGLASRNGQLLARWEAACACYQAGHPNLGSHVHDIHLVMGLIAGSVDSLHGRFELAHKRFDQLLHDSRDRAHAFYQIQGMATMATAMMRQALLEPAIAEVNCRQVLEVARALEDLAGSMLQSRRYRSAIYLQGKAYELLGEQGRAIERYDLASKVEPYARRSSERDAIVHDLMRLTSGTARTAPPASTFSVGSTYLPLP